MQFSKTTIAWQHGTTYYVPYFSHEIKISKNIATHFVCVSTKDFDWDIENV